MANLARYRGTRKNAFHLRRASAVRNLEAAQLRHAKADALRHGGDRNHPAPCNLGVLDEAAEFIDVLGNHVVTNGAILSRFLLPAKVVRWPSIAR